MQDYTRLGHVPPNPPAPPGWPERVRDHHIEMRIDAAELPSAAFKDPTLWYVGVHDRAGHEIYRHDATGTELAGLATPDRDHVTVVRRFESETAPASWTVLPHSASKGWLDRVTRPIAHEPEIFIAIAAYRDPDLIPTIEDCLAKARHPERLRFGVCWQHGAEDDLASWLTGTQFRVTDVNWRDSRGPSWARAAAMSLYDGEDWYLQLDSHHRFAQDWDTKLTEQAALTAVQSRCFPLPHPTRRRADTQPKLSGGLNSPGSGQTASRSLQRPASRITLLMAVRCLHAWCARTSCSHPEAMLTTCRAIPTCTTRVPR